MIRIIPPISVAGLGNVNDGLLETGENEISGELRNPAEPLVISGLLLRKKNN